MAVARSAKVIAGAFAAVVGLIVAHEGRVLHTYPDPVLGWRFPTACYGHTGPELEPGQQFTEEECQEMLKTDLRWVYDELNKCMPLTLKDHELGAFMSLAYNTGPARVCNSSIPTKLRAGDAAAACATITQFVYVGGLDCRDPKNNCRGIPRRRAAERALCEGVTA